MFKMTTDPEAAPDDAPQVVDGDLREGNPVAIDGERARTRSRCSPRPTASPAATASAASTSSRTASWA
jgi:argininosuccinate synthase